MSTRTATNKNYYIVPGSLEMTENFQGDAHRISAWMAGNPTVKAYYPSSDAFKVTEGGSYRELPVLASSIYIGEANYGQDLNIYIRLDSGEENALLVFSPKGTDEYRPEGTPKYNEDGTVAYTSYYICIGRAVFTAATDSTADSYTITWDSGTLDSDGYWSGVGELQDAFGVEGNLIVPKKQFARLNVGGPLQADSIAEGTSIRLPNGSRLEVPDGEGNVIAGLGNKDGYLIWAGGTSGSDAVFSVTKNGKVHATEAEIEGNITARAAIFSGYSQNDFIFLSDVYKSDSFGQYMLDGKYSHIRAFFGSKCVLPTGKEYVGRRIVIYDSSSAGGITSDLPIVSIDEQYCTVYCAGYHPIYGFNANDVHKQYDSVKEVYFSGGAMEFLAVPYGQDSCRWFVVTDTSTWKCCDKSIFSMQKQPSLLYYGILTCDDTAHTFTYKHFFNALGESKISALWVGDGRYLVSLSNLKTFAGDDIELNLSTECVVSVFGYGEYRPSGALLGVPITAAIESLGSSAQSFRVILSAGENLVNGSFMLRIEFIG